VVALQLAYALVQLKGEFGMGNPTLQELSTMLMYLWLIAGMIWVVLLVHQDALPGTKQDWLMRPIRRVDVLMAKAMFAVLVVQGSTIAGDLLQGLGSGFPLGQSLHAALVHAAIGFIAITIPTLLLGALTQSIAEAVAMLAVMGVGVFALTLMAVTLAGGYEHQFDPTNGSGMHWIPNLLRLTIILAGGAAILAMQYRTRKTFWGRIAAAGVVVLLLCSQAIPWRPVFAVERRLSAQPGAADGIAMSWNLHPSPKDSNTSGRFEYGGIRVEKQGPHEDAWMSLPVTVTGLPTDSVLMEDNAQVVLTDADGKKLQEVDGGGTRVVREGAQSGPATYKQLAAVPAEIFRENKDRMVRVKTTYSMTLFKLGPSYSMPAVGGDRLIPGWGRCESNVDPTNTFVMVRCMQMGKGPACATVFMEDPRDGSRNHRNTDCRPDYAPYLEGPIPDAVTHFAFLSQFRDRNGEAKYAVDETKVDGAQIVIRMYEVAEHFTRVVSSPLIAMKDLKDLTSR
jgi:hypothetical protein